MIVKLEYATNIGSRKNNDDSLFIRYGNKTTVVSDGSEGRAGIIYANTDSDGIIAAVFDGMGGKKLGQYSSQLCCKRISEIENPSAEDVINIDKEFKGTGISDYGTTISLVNIKIDPDNSIVHLKTISAGDSPIISVQDGTMRILSPLDNQAYEDLVIDQRESEYRGGLQGANKLMNFIGRSQPLVAHEGEYSLPANSKLLVCTDGVLQNSNESISSIMMFSERPAEELVKSAIKAKKRSDNVTAIVISLLQDEFHDFIFRVDDDATESEEIVKKSFIKRLRRKKHE